MTQDAMTLPIRAADAASVRAAPYDPDNDGAASEPFDVMEFMVTATVEERLSRIEGAYEHLATKADVSQLEIRMVNSEARMIRWMVGLVLGGLGAGIGLTTFLVRTL